MHKKLTGFALVATTALSAANSYAQQAPQTEATRRGVGDTSIFAPMDLSPAPNVYRDASGAPGPKYWQNQADYDLHATLDTAQNTVRGSMTLRYTNNSPDTLYFVWVQTEQNAFRPGSLNSMVFPPGSRFGGRGFNGGDAIDSFQQVVNGKKVSVKLRDQGTVTKVDLVQPLAPGKTATLEASWHFPVPDHGADRMGHDGALYEIAQWYPRMCVFDDLHGWNTDPYLGQAEFYLDYGNYTMSVTVPAGYIVAATGALDNAHEVLTATEISRLAKAAKSETPIPIITEQDLTSGAARLKKDGMMTWKFTSKDVRDAVWAAAPNYQWDASSWHGILAQSYYRPGVAAAVWGNGEAADQAKMSIQEYSERWFQYPWPQISAVEGPISGMEYPMLAMESETGDKFNLYGVVTHEIGHDWFPMIVGSNERIHFWQDEGFNTFINLFSEARRYPQNGDEMQRAAQERAQIEQTQQMNIDVPIEVPGDRIDPNKLGFTEYNKTSAGLQLLREEILGHEAFDDGFRTYIKRWAFKHPTPTDFYRTMENVAGRRLDWFWREWFYENPHFDQAIDTVVTKTEGGTERLAVRYRNDARGVLPIIARFTFSDGTTQDFHYPAEVWSMDTKFYVRHYEFPGKTVTRIDLDPDHHLVDIDRSNNTWVAK